MLSEDPCHATSDFLSLKNLKPCHRAEFSKKQSLMKCLSKDLKAMQVISLYVNLVSCLLITERNVGLWYSGGKYLNFMFFIYKKPMTF